VLAILDGSDGCSSASYEFILVTALIKILFGKKSRADWR